MIRCANWAKSESQIRSNITSKINEIIFFTPVFSSDRVHSINKQWIDVANYSCAIDEVWVVVYRPSCVVLVVKRASGYGMIESRVKREEDELNGNNPVLALVPNYDITFSGIVDWPIISSKRLPDNVRENPDQYLLPLEL